MLAEIAANITAGLHGSRLTDPHCGVPCAAGSSIHPGGFISCGQTLGKQQGGQQQHFGLLSAVLQTI